MIIILIIVFLMLAFSFYMLLCSLVHLPSLKSTIAQLHLTQDTGKKMRTLDALILNLATRLSKYIPISDDRREVMTATLQSTGMMITPETYYAKVIVRFLLKSLPAVIILFILPVAAAVYMIWPVWTLFDDLKEAEKRMNQKIKKIDGELPGLAADISEELKTDRDVVRILSSYLPSAGKELKEELEITIADMKSGSPDKALTRMDTRIGSLMLSQVIRGLHAVLHGDNCLVYFQMLSYIFKQSEIQSLRLAAKKLPDKMRVPAIIILACVFLTLFAVIIIFLYRKLNAFG
ncbi:MAG TPA: secretion protein F [Caproicibacter sp.]|nr:secretion protein F [Caproicibacter sp.]